MPPNHSPLISASTGANNTQLDKEIATIGLGIAARSEMEMVKDFKDICCMASSGACAG